MKDGSLGKVLATLEKILKNYHARHRRRKGKRKGKYIKEKKTAQKALCGVLRLSIPHLTTCGTI
jgi:hypothetical protein